MGKDGLDGGFEELTANLVAKAQISEVRRFISHNCGFFRSESGLLVGLQVNTQLLVYDLVLALRGDAEPKASFAAPSPNCSSDACPMGFSPDLSLAVCAEEHCVRAVDAAGKTLWQWDYEGASWGNDQRGSVVVAPDGSHVWAVVPAGNESQLLVALECASGKLLDRVVVFEGLSAASNLVLHPDGRHVGVTFIEPDLCATCWASLTHGSRIKHWFIDSDEEVVLGVDPSGKLLATANLQGYFIGLRRFPDGELISETSHEDIRRVLGENLQDAGGYWSHAWHHKGGFIDSKTVIAACRDSGERGSWTRELSHWLIDTTESPGSIRARIRYSDESPTEYVLGLGDGTWLTADDNTLFRWTRE